MPTVDLQQLPLSNFRQKVRPGLRPLKGDLLDAFKAT